MFGENENEFNILLTSLREKRSKQRRWGMDWTQKGVAKRLHVSRATYNYWENGKAIPSRDDLKNIVSDFSLDEKEEVALYRTAAQVPPIIDNLPPRNPFFMAREEHLGRLGKLLQETGTAKITQSISISGLGGIGKTELALEYAHSHYKNGYRAVLWVNAADETTLQGSYARLAQLLELPERNEQDQDQCVQAVKQWLANHTNWLLIMDNADDLPRARSFLPGQPLGHVVFTTRSQIIGVIAKQANRIELEEMTPEEGLLFLLQRSCVLDDETKLDTVAADIHEPAVQLVELLGGHPLALDQAGAYIEETRVSFTDYLKLYQENRRFLLKRRLQEGKYSEHPESVAATFELSFKKACERHPLATDILHFCAFLQPDAIPEELFQHDDSFMLNPTAFNEGIAALHRYSLIKRNMQEKTFSMHRLVQAVLIDPMSHDLQKQLSERVVRALNAAFPQVNFKEWVRCERLLSHMLASAAWSEDELTPIVGVARLLLKAGVYLRERGQYSESEPLLARALSIFKQSFGIEHPETAMALNNLGVLYFDQGKYEQAEPLHHQAISIGEKLFGAEHLDTVTRLQNLAALYSRQGKYEQAEPLLVRAISIREKHLGTGHPDTAYGLSILGHFYVYQKKYEQAEPLYHQAISIQEKFLGAEHPHIAGSLYGLAFVLHGQGKHEQAEVLSQRAHSIFEQQFGATDPYLQENKRAYAKFLHGIGHDAEAAALEANDEPSDNVYKL